MKAMITVDAIVVEINKMIKEYQTKYNKRPTIAFLGEGQLQALERADMLYSTTDEPSKIYGLKIEGTHASDFIHVGTEDNEMSAISPELVKARAEQMLGEHFRIFDYPGEILLGTEQIRAAVSSNAFDLSPHTGKMYLCGVTIKEVPIPNYIGVI